MKTEIRKKSPPTPPRYVPQPGDWFVYNANLKYWSSPCFRVDAGLFMFLLANENRVLNWENIDGYTFTKLNLVAIENGVMIFEES